MSPSLTKISSDLPEDQGSSSLKTLQEEVARLTRENRFLQQELSELQRSNATLSGDCEESKAVFEAAGVGIMVVDEGMHICSYNKQLKDYFFPTLDDHAIKGKTCRELICEGREAASVCPCRQIDPISGKAKAGSFRRRGRFYNAVFTPVSQDGSSSHHLGVFHDVTEVKLGEEALRRSEERYRDLFDNARDMIHSVDGNGHFVYTNQVWRETLGYTEAELPELVVFDIIDPSYHAHCHELLHKVTDGKSVNQAEVVFLAKDGRKIIVEGSVSCDTADGEAANCRGIFRDITARKQAEAALAAEKEQLAVTLRSIGDGVITTDTEGRIVLINKVAEELTGWSQEEACGLPLDRVFHIVSAKTGERCENPAEQVLRTGITVSLASQTALVSKDGTKRIIADSGAPICNSESAIIGAVLVFRDITEQLALEINQQRAEKLESVGILAGGIAHDFNNMLTGIVGNISIAKMYAEADSKIHERLAVAEKAAFRARDLTHQLLTFAKGGAPVMKTSSIQEILTDLSKFALRGSNVRCCFDIADDLWRGNMDTGQISQVIHNLLINADQAMPAGGQILVKAENKVLTSHDGLPLQNGNYVHISVCDAGIGIAAENLPRIFDPYFTTKEKGSGLGLATSYSIVKNHDGCITVDSTPGEGTTFHVFLPASPQGPAKSKQQWSKAVTGSGRILVMDDEEMIRDIAGALLRVIGYSVTFAEDGEQAIALYRESMDKKEPFDVVIMDLTVPGAMGGKEAITQLLELDPQVKALVSSGYSTDPVMSDYRSFGFKGMVLKPYVIEDLSKALQRVLQQ
jgi:PAS domain S-box-containing protein